MPQQEAGVACPTCAAIGNGDQMLYMQHGGGGLRCQRNSEHIFRDSEEIQKFKKLAVAPQPDKVQVNQTVMQITLPEQVKRDLEAKHGQKLNATMTSLAQISLLPRIVFLTEEDVQRIEQQCGQPIKSGAALFGVFFAEKKKVEEKDNELATLQQTVMAFRGKSPTSVLVDLGDQLPNAIAKSKESGKTLEEYSGDFLRKALENGWTE
jgi:hypothetical protein